MTGDPHGPGGNNPAPYDLWRQAGGETDEFDRDRYRALLVDYGHLAPPAPGEPPQPLPAGWPANRYPPDRQWLETAHLTHGERIAVLGPRPWRIPSFEETEDS